ncbi:hypothetical protein V5799_024963 [Amblyomma americanum]|uniref:Uncharacterized protein n=1 Tax=Amblyomma americanum TaxID=6943 RepID=A0AAQ4EAT9_AMBAM
MQELKAIAHRSRRLGAASSASEHKQTPDAATARVRSRVLLPYCGVFNNDVDACWRRGAPSSNSDGVSPVSRCPDVTQQARLPLDRNFNDYVDLMDDNDEVPDKAVDRVVVSSLLAHGSKQRRQVHQVHLAV